MLRNQQTRVRADPHPNLLPEYREKEFARARASRTTVRQFELPPRRSILRPMTRGLLLLALACSFIVGCVERKLTVVSQPDGALVHLNNQEIGRTTVSRDFIYYGDYDV